MEDLFNNPLKYLIILLIVLIFLLLLFKFLNWLETLSGKNKKKEEKKSENEKVEENSSKNEPEQPTNNTSSNYLYDRFVENPTKEDNINIKVISNSFITEEKFKEIKNNKTNIEVKASHQINTDNLGNELQKLSQNNKTEKEKLLDEFNTLSREMKLLLIENILQKKDKQ